MKKKAVGMSLGPVEGCPRSLKKNAVGAGGLGVEVVMSNALN
jgi:hypothetical protein